MIKLISTIPSWSPMFYPVINAIRSIQKKLESIENSNGLNMLLREMRFDPRYTKPADFSGVLVLKTLVELNSTVLIKPYLQNYFAWRFVPVNGYVDPSEPLVINLNTRQVRSSQAWEETIWHELIHVADAFSTASFDHGDNKLSGKDETAPVKLARVMSGMIIQDRSQSA